MQRFAAVVRLRPEREAKYRALHAAAWPDYSEVISGAEQFTIALGQHEKAAVFGTTAAAWYGIAA
jgi:L-rhamnose mutarotase